MQSELNKLLDAFPMLEEHEKKLIIDETSISFFTKGTCSVKEK